MALAEFCGIQDRIGPKHDTEFQGEIHQMSGNFFDNACLGIPPMIKVYNSISSRIFVLYIIF